MAARLQGGRCQHHRAHQCGRVAGRSPERQPGVRPHQQPLGPEPDVRRFQRRRRRGGGQRHDSARRGLGSGRFAAPAGQFLRRLCAEDDRAPGPADRVLPHPGRRAATGADHAQPRSAGPRSRRSRACAVGDLRSRRFRRRRPAGAADPPRCPSHRKTCALPLQPPSPGRRWRRCCGTRWIRWPVPSPMPVDRCGKHFRRSPGRSRASCSASSSSWSPRSSRRTVRTSGWPATSSCSLAGTS